MEGISDQLVFFATTYGLRIVGAILILLAGRIAAGLERRIVIKLLRRARSDESTSFSVSGTVPL
jgi:small conductance mechanosensitive channel